MTRSAGALSADKPTNRVGGGGGGRSAPFRVNEPKMTRSAGALSADKPTSILILWF
jgi:hypothetical protein